MTSEPLPKDLRPEEFEARWIRRWEELDLFRGGREPSRRPYVIVIPPPNITGNLHLGHALDNTLQDILIRWRRMQGYDALWVPGIDHAGIATQMVVEKDLKRRGISRREIGRERFVEEVWKWKEANAASILATLRSLGCSCDWSRTRFTLDEGLSRAVREVFVSLHEDGLIYREHALVNWCPSCRTALSDLEVDREEGRPGHLWEIAYPVEGSDRSLIVATTRPETMLGDTAVAVHPEDERYRALIGRTVRLPLSGRTIPIIADPILVDREFGTGVVKVTPAHDFNDFAAGKRGGLPALTIFDEEGRVNAAGGAYAGLDRFEARERVVADLEREGALVGVKDHLLSIAVCDRCGTVLEPRHSPQWFVRIAPLAEPALAAVEQGRIEIYPPAWAKTYYEWMRNIHDWCISRQLWWGHRIPAWYCPSGHITVARDTPAACSTCGTAELRQDEDVLDTWFSSGLWPFSTLGWPDESPDLKRYYPTSVLVTGPDILFFWVARMIMMGLRFRGDVPFHRVCLHGLVRDEHGEKMSKTRGNVILPETAMEKYGTDSLRFTLAAGASPGPSVPLSPARLEGYRAFANKIWNAARFVLMNLEGEPARPASWPPARLSLADRWILARLDRTSGEVNEALEAFRFDLAASAAYQFAWHSFCDVYIEMSKSALAEGGEAAAAARAVLARVLATLLRLLHPFMPFVTEELAARLPGAGESLAVEKFPAAGDLRRDEEAEAAVDGLIELVAGVRQLRAEAGIEPGRRVPLRVTSADAAAREAANEARKLLIRLCQLESIEVLAPRSDDILFAGPAGDPRAGGAVRALAGEYAAEIPAGVLTDPAALRRRIEKDLERINSDLAGRERKLASDAFVSRAPAEIVEKEKAIVAEMSEKKHRLGDLLAGLSAG